MEEQSTTKIREIFTSIQGEGPCIGQKKIFVRFCKCNLTCDYCDTDFQARYAQKYTPKELYEELKYIDCDTISFTGGEPLMDVAFLKEFLKRYKEKLGKKIYLETNGILYEELSQIIDWVDVVAMDIKIETATGQKTRHLHNQKFLEIASSKKVFAKVVFDENILQFEVDECINIAKKHNTLLILQPKMPMNEGIDLMKIYDMFYKTYQNVRLVPQVHKYLNLA